MPIFNSLGSNYHKHFRSFARRLGRPGAVSELRDYLKESYDAETVSVMYKGREAITLALNSLDVVPGSGVAVCGYTCYAVYDAVTAAGLTPVYIDIAKDDLNFSLKSLQAAHKANPDMSVVMLQNTLGIPADGPEIKEFCNQHNLILLEDMAHCVGMPYRDGQEAGTLGAASAFSFSQDKLIDAVSGGATVFHQAPTSPPLEESFRHVSHYRRLADYLYPSLTATIRATHSIGIGKVLLKVFRALKLMPRPMNGQAATPHRLPKWHCGLAILAFEQLPHVIMHRQHIAEVYRQVLPEDVQFKHLDQAIYLRFPIRIEEPKRLVAYLKQFGVHLSDTWYDAPIAPKRLFSRTDYAGQCPNSEYVAARMVNLPTHVNINRTQAQFIAGKVKQWLQSQ